MTDIEKKIIENYNNDLLFNNQLDDYFLGSLNPGASIKIGTTPYSILLVNANKYDLVINQSVLKNSMNSEDIKIKHHSSGHNISLEFIKKLPEAIRNPLMIFKGRNNSIILITDFMDFKNRNIIIPIELNCQGYANKVNKITSIYGRTNIEKFIKKHLVEKNILAYNKNKTDKLFYQIGQQLSNDEQIISYDDSISYTTENVKYPTKERSEIMEEKIKENLNFTEVISHDEFIQSKPVKDVKQLENKELNKNSIALDEKAPAKYTAQHIKETYSQELDKSKAYTIPQEPIVNIENELDSSKENILDVLKQMADNKDLHAKNMLALAYYFGDSGATKDVDKAIELFVEAAGDGYAVAQRNLAIICETSEPKDMEKAIEYYNMAINNKTPDAYALNNLGVCYLTGEGVESNPKKAVELFTKAAELGDDYAKLNLADAYYLGNGTRQSFKKAFELYKEVAEKGNVTALKYLAECYQEGKGTEVNYKLALECYQKAAEKGDEEAKYKYTELNNKINPHKHVEVDNAVKQSLGDNIKEKQDTIKEAYEQKKLDKSEQEKIPDIADNPDNKQEQAPEKAQQAKPEKTRNDGPEL